MDKTDMDAVFMRRCLQLASLGRGHVSPNPMVGAVVVHPVSYTHLTLRTICSV